MKCFVILLALASVTCGLQYNGVTVKFGETKERANIDHFYEIPETIVKAVVAQGWYKTERPPGPMPELVMYCPPGRIVCALYHPTGFIAGLQIALPVEDYETPINNLDIKFVKWHASAANGEKAKDYWTSTQYYVSEEILESGIWPIENDATLQFGNVWVTGLEGRLIKLPINEVDLNKTDYKKQNCRPNMGTHYYPNMTRDLQCENYFHWFGLVTKAKLIGTGFHIFGRLKNEVPNSRSWFDNIPKHKRGIKAVIPYAPDCFGQWSARYGLISLHIYYTKTPWEIDCKSSDFVQPALFIEPPLCFPNYQSEYGQNYKMPF